VWCIQCDRDAGTSRAYNHHPVPIEAYCARSAGRCNERRVGQEAVQARTVEVLQLESRREDRISDDLSRTRQNLYDDGVCVVPRSALEILPEYRQPSFAAYYEPTHRGKVRRWRNEPRIARINAQGRPILKHGGEQ
jgi:hypothetical protein